MNRLKKILKGRNNKLLSIYFTAGYPRLSDTIPILEALQKHGADLIEIGMPYSDPLADGPVIQESSMKALSNGMSIPALFKQLKDFKEKEKRNQNIPFILMGYLNPVLQFGIEKFMQDAQSTGIDGVIIPDLPLQEYERFYQRLFKKYDLKMIFLVTPETSEIRIKQIDKLSDAFIYAVSSSSITGTDKDMVAQQFYFKKLENLKLKNPVLVGFGIKDANTFQLATANAAGAIIGSAYIKTLAESSDIDSDTKLFLNSILEGRNAS